MITGILTIFVLVLLGYAFYQHYYTQTDTSKGVAARVVVAVGMACAAVGASIMQLLHSGTVQ